MPTSFKNKLLSATFVVYLAVVAALTIVPTHFPRFRIPDSNHINLVPLGYSFKCFLQARRWPELRAGCLRNTLGNIALFLPLGMLLPLVSNRCRSFKRVVLIALCLSVGIETTQFFLRFVGTLRSPDIDDVLLNTLGACLGFVVYVYVARGRRTEVGDQRSEIRGQRSEVGDQKGPGSLDHGS